MCNAYPFVVKGVEAALKQYLRMAYKLIPCVGYGTWLLNTVPFLPWLSKRDYEMRIFDVKIEQAPTSKYDSRNLIQYRSSGHEFSSVILCKDTICHKT